MNTKRESTTPKVALIDEEWLMVGSANLDVALDAIELRVERAGARSGDGGRSGASAEQGFCKFQPHRRGGVARRSRWQRWKESLVRAARRHCCRKTQRRKNGPRAVGVRQGCPRRRILKATSSRGWRGESGPQRDQKAAFSGIRVASLRLAC